MSALTTTIQNYIYGPDKFSKSKRNFIKENMKLVKKTQAEPKEKNDIRKSVKKAAKKSEEEKVVSNTNKSFEKMVADMNQISEPKLKIPENKEQGSQTCLDDLDGCHVRFPKDRAKTPPPPDGKKNMSLQVNPADDLIYKSNDVVGVIAPTTLPTKEDGRVDFVKLNMLIPPKKKPPLEKYDPIKAPPTYQRGVIPKYLRIAKQQQIEEVQEKGLVEVIDDLDENCYILVSDDEKKERLKEIRLAYAQLVTELNSIPFRSDSPKIQARKEQIESNLHKLEDGIKLFSREKLYLKVTVTADWLSMDFDLSR